VGGGRWQQLARPPRPPARWPLSVIFLTSQKVWWGNSGVISIIDSMVGLSKFASPGLYFYFLVLFKNIICEGPFFTWPPFI
jgi:hypothetical protein